MYTKATPVTIAIPGGKAMIKFQQTSNRLVLTFLLVSVFATASLFSQSVTKRIGEIKYISQNSYYINLGSKQGFAAGDTLSVLRNGRLIAQIVVDNIANLSSSCKLLTQRSKIRQGDRVEGLVTMTNLGFEKEETKSSQVRLPGQGNKSKRTVRKTRKSQANKTKGRLSVQLFWLDDKSRSNSDYFQLGLRSKFKVQKFLNSPFDLRLRWRSRGHKRDHVLSNILSDNEWKHTVYELGLVYSKDDSPYEVSLGRILSHRIRGIGYVDGGFFSYKINGFMRLGVVGGTQPGLRGSSFQTDEQKMGLFVNFEKGDYKSQRFDATIAFSGRYNKGDVSREFLYLQNSYWMGSKLSIYQTVEVDINRGWKKDDAHDRLQLSNFFVSTRFSPTKFISLNASYDARKTIRVFETRSIPDSLFDETIRQGLHTGITLNLPYRLRFSGNFGMRFRKGVIKNTISASGALSARQIFNTWATVSLRLSYFSTMFTKGYRPNFSIRLPVVRGLAVNFAGGSYIYQTGIQTTYSSWAESTGYYRINRWLFANFGYRIYFDQRLKSGRLFVETGVVF